jgi:hypothetical protein
MSSRRWVSAVALVLLPGRCAAGASLCALGVDGLRDWLLREAGGAGGDGWAGALQGHAHALHANRVDGAALCFGPPGWIREQFHPAANYSSSGSSIDGSTPSSTHACGARANELVDQALALWHGNSGAGPRPSAALDALSAAALADGQCCAPFREFSRFFLGGNSPFIQLRDAAAKEEALQAAWRVWRQPLPPPATIGSAPDARAASLASQWRLLAGYATAHALFYGPQGDKAAAADVFRDLLALPMDTDAAAAASKVAAGASSADTAASAGSSSSSQAAVFATVASEERPELGHLRASALRAGVVLQVLGLGEKYEGHETKLRLYDAWLSSGAVQPNDVVR